MPEEQVRIPNELKPDSKRYHARSYARIPSCQDRSRRMWGRDSMTELWELYSFGYKMAGDLLIENVGRYTSYLICPVVFSYRHCIE